MNDITQLLHALETPGSAASEELLPLVYDELRRHASIRMAREPAGHTLQATALVHEAWMRIVHSDGTQRWQNRAHFFGAAAESMRRILIEKARRRSRQKRGGGALHLNIDDVDVAAAEAGERLVQLDEALECLKQLSPEKAQVVIYKFYLGLSDEEAANCLGLSERTVSRHWAYSKAWLFQHLQQN